VRLVEASRKLLRVQPPFAWPLIAAILSIQNLLIFYDHYRKRAFIPWDFPLTYFAIPFYWQGIIRSGHFPQWIPFQAFGYPLQMNLQASFYYPPFWSFPLMGITYSLHAAIVFQVLHILAGALGASWLARRRDLSYPASLLVGFAYQFFGGFFCNMSHPDIVRGYALTPWLLGALTLGRSEHRQPPSFSSLAVAPIIFLLATGSYPGLLPASLALGFLYLGAQFFEHGGRRRALLLSFRAAMIVLGLLLAMVHLGPAFLLRRELDRSQALPGSVTGADYRHLLTTLFPYDVSWISGDIAMRSLFITVPIVAGLFFVHRTAIRKQSALLIVGLTATLMIQGGEVFRLVTRLVPPLGYSRFPIADYRAFACLPALLLGAVGLGRLVGGAPIRYFALRCLLLCGCVATAANSWRTLSGEPIAMGLVYVLAAFLVIALLGRRQRTLALWAGLALLYFDGMRMHEAASRPWTAESAIWSYDYGTDFENAYGELERNAQTPLEVRPAREPHIWTHHGYPPNLDGYIRGRYVADDYAAGDHLRVIRTLWETPQLREWLTAAASPKLLDPTAIVGGPIGTIAMPSIGKVVPKRFSAEKIAYHVSTASPAVLVENEPSFPGWHALAFCDQAIRVQVQPITSLWPLRAWSVPAGEYDFCEEFSPPWLRLSALISLSALAGWLALVMRAALLRRRSSFGQA
jgi:hypothetical protein